MVPDMKPALQEHCLYKTVYQGNKKWEVLEATIIDIGRQWSADRSVTKKSDMTHQINEPISKIGDREVIMRNGGNVYGPCISIIITMSYICVSSWVSQI